MSLRETDRNVSVLSVARMSGPLDHTMRGVGSPEAIQVREKVDPSTALLLFSGGEKVGGTEWRERESWVSKEPMFRIKDTREWQGSNSNQ